jgi:H+/Cl- antiporter ClcA
MPDLDLVVRSTLLIVIFVLAGFLAGWGIRWFAYEIVVSGIERDLADLRRRIGEARAKTREAA